MKYLYSVIRFVPDPVRGEFVNIGALVGSEESSEWEVRQIENPIRARQMDDQKVLDAAWSFIDEVGRWIDQYHASLESLFNAQVELSESWMQQLYDEHRNIVQLSPPAPILAESTEEALERIFDLMVVDPSRRRFPYKKKHAALVAARRSYSRHNVRKGQGLHERVVLLAEPHRECLDFAVTNGRVAQLAHTWSFQVPDQDKLAEQVKAWGWTLHEVRVSGGVVKIGEQARLTVPKDVDIEVVYVPPMSERGSPAWQEARSVFAELGVTALTLEDANKLGERAHELLASPGGGRLPM